MVGRCALLEQQRDIFLQPGLIAFDSRMVMGLSFNQIVRPLALRQQGIGADRLAGDIEGIEHGGKHPDFIGLLGFVLACYRKGADFFWA